MFFIFNNAQPVPKGMQMPTCYGPYSSKDEALDALKAFTQPGTYALVGPATATGDTATIEPAKVTLGKVSER